MSTVFRIIEHLLALVGAASLLCVVAVLLLDRWKTGRWFP